MIKKFQQYNESVLDQMTGPDEETLRKNLGEENYKIYKAVSDAKDSIEPPFKIDDSLISQLTDVAQYRTLDIRFWFIRYLIRYDGKQWEYRLEFKEPMYFDTWVDVYQQMISDANKIFKKEINTVQTNVDRYQNKIKIMKKDLEKVNKLL